MVPVQPASASAIVKFRTRRAVVARFLRAGSRSIIGGFSRIRSSPFAYVCARRRTSHAATSREENAEPCGKFADLPGRDFGNWIVSDGADSRGYEPECGARESHCPRF